MIKNIVFDFGGVIIDWNPHYLYDKYFGDKQKSHWFIENICDSAWNIQMDGGKPFAEGVAELSAEYPQWREAIEIYFSRWIEMIGGEIAGTADLIRRIKRGGYGVYGLTNWSNETFSQVRYTYPIFGELDGMVVSADEHLIKPDAAIYKCLLERYSLDPQQSLFTDDSAKNVEGAVKVGMPAVRFESAEQLEGVLRNDYGLSF